MNIINKASAIPVSYGLILKCRFMQQFRLLYAEGCRFSSFDLTSSDGMLLVNLKLCYYYAFASVTLFLP